MNITLLTSKPKRFIDHNLFFSCEKISKKKRYIKIESYFIYSHLHGHKIRPIFKLWWWNLTFSMLQWFMPFSSSKSSAVSIPVFPYRCFLFLKTKQLYLQMNLQQVPFSYLQKLPCGLENAHDIRQTASGLLAF